MLKAVLNEAYVTKKEFQDLEREVSRLRRKLGRSGAQAAEAPKYNGKTEEELQLSVRGLGMFDSTKVLMLALFSTSTIINSSVSGKKANSRCIAKPPFPPTRYGILRKILGQAFPGEPASAITARIQSVQKHVRNANKT